MNTVQIEECIMNNTTMYINEVGNIPLLTREEEEKLLLQCANGDNDAKKILIERNLKLVISTAKKYSYINDKFELLDLIQEGNIGLIYAIDNFDINKYTRFSSYAFYWIKRFILNKIGYYKRNTSVANINAIQYKIKKRKLESELYHTPTYKEIANYIGISLNDVYELEKLILEPYSLNTPIDLDGGDEIIDFVPDETCNLERICSNIMLSEDLLYLINNSDLTDSELEIIKYLYGLDNYDIMSQSEIARLFNVSRERIRLAEANALRKIRNNSLTDNFIVYMNNSKECAINIKKYRHAYQTSHDSFKKRYPSVK